MDISSISNKLYGSQMQKKVQDKSNFLQSSLKNIYCTCFIGLHKKIKVNHAKWVKSGKEYGTCAYTGLWTGFDQYQ